MRRLNLSFVALIGLALALAAPARADDEADALRERALAMLRLAAPAPVLEPAATPVVPRRSPCLDDLAAARSKATAEKRPLLIWVGGCESVDQVVRGAFPDAVHCHCDALNGSSEHRLLIPTQAGSYAVFNSDTLTPASLADIRSVIEKPAAKVAEKAVQAVPVQSSADCPNGQCAVPQAQAVRTYAVPVTSYGSFGAGSSGGGCANGQCGVPATTFRRR